MYMLEILKNKMNYLLYPFIPLFIFNFSFQLQINLGLFTSTYDHTNARNPIRWTGSLNWFNGMSFIVDYLTLNPLCAYMYIYI